MLARAKIPSINSSQRLTFRPFSHLRYIYIRVYIGITNFFRPHLNRSRNDRTTDSVQVKMFLGRLKKKNRAKLRPGIQYSAMGNYLPATGRWPLLYMGIFWGSELHLSLSWLTFSDPREDRGSCVRGCFAIVRVSWDKIEFERRMVRSADDGKYLGELRAWERGPSICDSCVRHLIVIKSRK